MNYQLHYNNLIERAKTRLLEGYCERHHIMPKCMGGSDKKDNLVELTAEEHFVAHQLLVKIYSGNTKLIYAAGLMTTDRLGNRVGNKLYGWIRNRMSESRIGQKRKPHTREAIQKMSDIKKGKKFSTETKQRMSESQKKRIRQKHSVETIQKMSDIKKGKKFSTETKQRMSEVRKGKMQQKATCPYCDKVGGKSLMTRWHFENCKQKEINIMLTI